MPKVISFAEQKAARRPTLPRWWDRVNRESVIEWAPAPGGGFWWSDQAMIEWRPDRPHVGPETPAVAAMALRYVETPVMMLDDDQEHYDEEHDELHWRLDDGSTIALDMSRVTHMMRQGLGLIAIEGAGPKTPVLCLDENLVYKGLILPIDLSKRAAEQGGNSVEAAGRPL